MFRSTTYFVAIALLCAGCSEPHPADPIAWGQEIYGRTLCGQCHGADQRGTIQGPPLENLREHWTADELAAYLAAPMNYVDTQPRLRALADHYKMLMPAMPLSDEERKAVAAFLLQGTSAAPSTPTSASTPPSHVRHNKGGGRYCVSTQLSAVRFANPGRGSIKPMTSTSYETPPGYGIQTALPRVAPKRRNPGLWNINPSGIERPQETPT